MKFGEVADALTMSALQTSFLHQALQPASEFGRRAFDALAPFCPGQESLAASHSAYVADLAVRLQSADVDAIREALAAAPDPQSAIARISMGDALDDSHLLTLQRFLDAAKIVQSVFAERMPSIEALIDGQVAAVAQLLETGRAGRFGFYLADAFEKALSDARAAADRAQAEYDAARGRLSARVAHALGRDEPLEETFIVMRDAAHELPAELRTVREAPTYYLCEIELDEAALHALSRRDEAAQRVASEETHLRQRISQRIREESRALQTLMERLARIDVEIAQAAFAQRYACAPATYDESALLTLQRARFLPLAEELAARGRVYAPISIDLRETAVVTGPNMGGKSAALRACGFVALLAAFGVPVPAASARCALFDEIAWLGIGAMEEPAGLLSSFAGEVVRLKELLARGARNCLLLIDEFARTTTPQEGKALLVATVRGLLRRKCLAFVATHFAGVASAAGVAHFAVRGLRDAAQSTSPGDLNAALSALAASMDYTLVRVEGDERPQADAIALAQLLGLDEDIVERAKEVLWTR